MEMGKKFWIFADGDLPPHGDNDPLGHEALMIVNNNKSNANIELEMLFEDSEPVSGIRIKVSGKRVKCFRLDYPLGEQQYSIPFGQYALIVNSDVPVVAVFGRLDRRKDMAFYSVAPYCE